MNKLVAVYSLLHLFCVWSKSAGFENSTNTNVLVTERGVGEQGIARSLVVYVVIGICGAVVVLGIASFGVFCFFVNRHRVEDLDAVEYSIQEEYVAQINFEVLGHLDPAIRSRINMNFLARFTNTEPALLAPYKNEMVGVIDSTSPKLSPLSTSDSVQSLHRCFSLILQKSHDTSCTNHSSYNHNWNNNSMKLKRSNTISGISSITMEESKCSISPVKFVVQCEGEQNEGAVKNLLKVVTGSWLVTSRLASMPDISNEMVRMKEKKSDGMEEDSEDIVYCVDGDNECAVGMEDRECALVMDREKYAVGVESGGYEEDQ